MRYQWNCLESTAPDLADMVFWSLDVDKKVSSYGKEKYVSSLANSPSLIKHLFVIEGIEVITILTSYKIQFQFGKLFDPETIKKQIINCLHEYLDCAGETIEVVSSSQSMDQDENLSDEQVWQEFKILVKEVKHVIKTGIETFKQDYLKNNN